MAGKFRIVAARPKGSVGQLNTEFKMYEHKKVDEKWRWVTIGWQSTHAVGQMLNSGAEVLTGKVVDKKMDDGDAVELELRIMHNGSKYKLSEMPDD